MPVFLAGYAFAVFFGLRTASVEAGSAGVVDVGAVIRV